MTDDDRLAELFRTAASDAGAPPPRFDHTDVVAASRRITARRRAAMVGGAALLAVVGVGAVVTLPGGSGPDTEATAAAPLAVPEDARDGASLPAQDQDQDNAEEYESAPGAAAAPASPAAGAPLGPGTGECADRQDPALRALLGQVLPEVAAAPAAATTEECRPGGDRYLALDVADGAAVGVLSISYLQPGVAVRPADGALSAPTASGGTVVVQSGPTGQGTPAPFENRLPAVLEFLAPRL